LNDALVLESPLASELHDPIAPVPAKYFPGDLSRRDAECFRASFVGHSIIRPELLKKHVPLGRGISSNFDLEIQICSSPKLKRIL
jgi:hypothetical protein